MGKGGKMKKYTHAWLAFRAVKYLEEIKLTDEEKPIAKNLVRFFKDHKDDVIQGAWYPDQIIKDMAESHVLKITPGQNGVSEFRKLPSTSLLQTYGKKSDLFQKSFSVNKNDNLPNRCEALSHSIVDNLKIQQSEEKGSPVSITDNHLALRMFMLSHYIADAHMPLHCDNRAFSSGINLHDLIEKDWEDAIKKYFLLDIENERFLYDKKGFPHFDEKEGGNYKLSYFQKLDDELGKRDFITGYGNGNDNVFEFMNSVCQYSYLLSYLFIPKEYNEKNVVSAKWKNIGKISFDEYSVAILTDAVDSIARVWFRVWRRYLKWKKEK